MHIEQRVRQFAQLAAIILVVVGCAQILLPFTPAILFAVVVCISSWPLYIRLRAALRGRSSLAALLMVLLLIVLVIGPSALFALSLTDNVATLVEAIKAFLGNGPIQSPAWLRDLPLIGSQLDGYWRALAAGGEEAIEILKKLLEPAKDLLLISGKALAHSLLQMILAVFIGFFFFRDGDVLVDALRTGLEKIAGSISTELLETIRGTVAGVVQGIFGTALAQALVATIGFFIAGVPGAFLLGVATFFSTVIPIGPPLIWGGASWWLYSQGSVGWAIFLALWGIFVVSTIDNLIKPYLISLGSGLPMLLIVLGVFGGIVSFGFIGIFIGPPLLAVGLVLVRLWTVLPLESGSSGTPPPP